MNIKNPSIKRIMADVRELQRHPSSRFHAAPLEGNMFEWHFTIRGPAGSDFEGGIYHGRILLPPEYPMKPPNIVFMTKNGRFEVGTKICLSISAYHEESWQPAWGVRTMLEAIISFFPSEGAGAIGALDWTKEERQRLVKESHSFCCPLCGLAKSLLIEPEEGGEDDKLSGEIAEQITQLRMKTPGTVATPRKVDFALNSDSSQPIDNTEQQSPDGKISGSDAFVSVASEGLVVATESLLKSAGYNTAGVETESTAEEKATNVTVPTATTGTSGPSLSSDDPLTSPQAAGSAAAVNGAHAAVAAAGAAVGVTPAGVGVVAERDFVDDILIFLLFIVGSAIALLLIRKLGRYGYFDGHGEL